MRRARLALAAVLAACGTAPAAEPPRFHTPSSAVLSGAESVPARRMPPPPRPSPAPLRRAVRTHANPAPPPPVPAAPERACTLLTGHEVARVAAGAGFRGMSLVEAIALAKAESGWWTCNPRMASGTSPTHDAGLWQINRVHWRRYGGKDALFDPGANAQAAYQISGGGTNWGPWVAWEKGRHRTHMAEAQEVASSR